MEKQKLPNSTLILVFGIISIVTCCCYGIIGLIFGIIALVMANNAIKKYKAEPELYTGYSSVNTGRILAIIGIVLSVIYIGYISYLFSTIGYEGLMEMQQEWMDAYQ